jgi:hypothetical protein
VFLLSGMAQERGECADIIFGLGGEILESSAYEQCTHLVCGQLDGDEAMRRRSERRGDKAGIPSPAPLQLTVAPSGSEKFIAAVAGAKWIVKPSFLTASKDAGHFVDESDHMWGVEVCTGRHGTRRARLIDSHCITTHRMALTVRMPLQAGRARDGDG